jgi:metallo-beta-lactamase family protein
MTLNIRFLGGANTVTGSKYCVEHGGRKLLVDCGLFQGYKQLRLRNWDACPIPPKNVDAVILTHAHLDHSGYLPLLARSGFEGKVHSTSGTRDLCAILLPDSGHIQEEDAYFANRHGYSKHAPALPLYTQQDAKYCMQQFHVEKLNTWFQPIPGWNAKFSTAGHILGASSLLLEVAGRRILFSGDLGRPDDSLTRGATLASGAPKLRLHGKDMPVAAEIVQLTSASAHADGNQLLAWLQKMPQAPAQVYVVHGELEASDTLRQRIERELGMRAVVPEHASVWPA